MSLAPLWRFHLLLQPLQTRPLHMEDTRVWPHLASLAGTSRATKAKRGWGHGCALCDSTP